MPGVAPTRHLACDQVFYVCDRILRLGHQLEDGARVLPQLLARRRQRYPAPPARKQPRSQAGLQVVNVLAHCRLRHQQLLRRGTETACAHYGGKDFKLVEI